MNPQQIEEMAAADSRFDRAAYYREAGYADQPSREALDAEMAERNRGYRPTTYACRCDLCGKDFASRGVRVTECADCWLPF